MLMTAITVVHVIVCAILIVVVLLQHGKSADIAAAFGGQGSQTAFGPRGTATALSKITTGAAILFLVTSVTLSILASRHRSGSGSVLGEEKPAATETQPAQQPATPNPAPQK
ncbi:MAG: preprotein translocase subunit SecG [Acidobacteria bacterium]|nr:preprotein translocase subunit SecG [Acidobacteriota bacterium]